MYLMSVTKLPVAVMTRDARSDFTESISFRGGGAGFSRWGQLWSFPEPQPLVFDIVQAASPVCDKTVFEWDASSFAFCRLI